MSEFLLLTVKIGKTLLFFFSVDKIKEHNFALNMTTHMLWFILDNNCYDARTMSGDIGI